MNKLEQAARALLAHWDTPAWKYLKPTGDLMADLREALDHSGEADEMVAEQAEHERKYGELADTHNWTPPNYTDEQWQKLDQEYRDHVAEQADREPVACIIHTEEGDYVDWSSKGYCFYIGETPLYAAPVRTKDLTEYEIDELRFQNLNYLDFARAVIAADREKNK